MSGEPPPGAVPPLPPLPDPLPAGLARALRALVAETTHLIGLLEPDGTIVYAGPSVASILGYEPAAVEGTNVLDLLHPHDLDMAVSMLAERAVEDPVAGRDDADVSGDYRLRHRDGHWVPFEVFRSDFTADPSVNGLLVIARPVVVRHALDEAFTALAHDDEGSEALHKLVDYLDVRIPGTCSSFHVAGTEGSSWARQRPVAELSAGVGEPLDEASDGGLVTVDLRDPAGLLPPVPRRWGLDQGFQACWYLPVPVRRPEIYRGADQGDVEPARLGGLVVWSRRRQRPLAAHLGVLERAGGLAEVVLRRRLATTALRRRVTYDEVTGALSRSGFEASTSGSTAGGDPYCLMVIDLDDFKHVNDSHGHPVGDQVLRTTAQRIQSLLRPEDILGRLGGDEFVLRLARADETVASAVAERILAALAVPLTVEGTAVPLRASIGIAGYDAGRNEDELIARADAAMYAAKRAGKGRWEVWQGQPVSG